MSGTTPTVSAPGSLSSTDVAGPRIPRISVLMPVFNGQLYLAEALGSVLEQTFVDFELIVVDDGSDDGTAEILAGCRDPRLVVLRHAANKGIVAALNGGLAAARAEWIARQDADDRSLPGRLAAQIAFVENHPEIGLVGCQHLRVSERGASIGITNYDTCDLKLNWRLLFGNPFSHTTVMYRRDLALRAGGYSADDLHAEDYGLWSRLARLTRIANMPEALVICREHSCSIRQRYPTTVKETSASISRANIDRLVGPELRSKALDFLVQLKRQQARLMPLERLLRECRAHWLELTHTLLPRLVDVYCEAKGVEDPERRRFAAWVSEDLGLTLLQVAGRCFKDRGHPWNRLACLQTWILAVRLQPRLIWNRRASRTLIKAGLGPRIVGALGAARRAGTT